MGTELSCGVISKKGCRSQASAILASAKQAIWRLLYRSRPEPAET